MHAYSPNHCTNLSHLSNKQPLRDPKNIQKSDRRNHFQVAVFNLMRFILAPWVVCLWCCFDVDSETTRLSPNILLPFNLLLAHLLPKQLRLFKHTFSLHDSLSSFEWRPLLLFTFTVVLAAVQCNCLTISLQLYRNSRTSTILKH